MHEIRSCKLNSVDIHQTEFATDKIQSHNKFILNANVTDESNRKKIVMNKIESHVSANKLNFQVSDEKIGMNNNQANKLTDKLQLEKVAYEMSEIHASANKFQVVDEIISMRETQTIKSTHNLELAKVADGEKQTNFMMGKIQTHPSNNKLNLQFVDEVLSIDEFQTKKLSNQCEFAKVADKTNIMTNEIETHVSVNMSNFRAADEMIAMDETAAEVSQTRFVSNEIGTNDMPDNTKYTKTHNSELHEEVYFVSDPTLRKPRLKYDYSLPNETNGNIWILDDVEKLESPKRSRHTCSSIIEPGVCNRCLKNEKNRQYYEHRLRDLERKHKILKIKYLKSVKSVHNYKYKSNAMKTSRKKRNLDSAIDEIDVSKNAKTLAKMLLKKRVTQYTQEQKELALNIHYKSNSTYSFLRDRLNLNLPSKSSIYRWTPVKHLTTGFNMDIITVLEEKFKTCTAQEKSVSLVLDAVSIRQELKYNEYLDKIVGFEDFKENSGTKSTAIAKEMLVFMVRGDFSDWKCVLSYFPSKNAITGETLKGLILKNIDILTGIGFKVSSVISDQGSGNRSAFNQLKVSKSNPYFLHNGQKIYVLYDICHLVKSARNSLMKNELKTPDGIASWKVIKELHGLDRKNATKMCPRLSDKHIFMNSFDKMKVSLATQVLSHSCAAAIKSLNHQNVFSEYLKKNVLPTALFLEKMDSIFDCMNSKVKYDNRKILKSALQKENVVYRYLKNIIPFVEQIQSPTKVRFINTCVLKVWVLNANSLQKALKAELYRYRQTMK